MSQGTLHLPQTTQNRLVQFRSLVRRIKTAEALLVGLFGLLISWIALFLLDRVIDTPWWVRLLCLIAGAVGPVVFVPARLHRWIWGTRRLEQVATLLRQKYPALGDQVLGAVELVHSKNELPGSLRLAQAAIDQVDAAIRNRDFSDAVPTPRHRRWALITFVPACLVLLTFVLIPAAGWNATVRWLSPWSSLERYTFARIIPMPSRLVIPHGEEFPLTLSLDSATLWTPAKATASMNGLTPIRSEVKAGKYAFVLPALTRSSQLQLRAGDWTKTVDIEVADRPELTAMMAQVTLPKYLQYSQPVKTDVRGGAVSVLKGASAVFSAEISRDLKNAAIDGAAAVVDGTKVLSPVISVADSQIMQFSWQDMLGLSSRDAFRLKIQAVDDKKPDVSMQATEPLQIVLTTDTVTFDLQSRDDFGVKSVGIEWNGVAHPVENPVPQSGNSLVEAGSPEKTRLAARAAFCAATENVEAQALEIRAWVEDYLPERGRTYSSPTVIHVMTPEQHSVWVMEQLRRWASLADDVYEEEIRLHDVNREIRQMSNEQLNTPETRRRIEQQAAAEKTNAQRLDSVVAQGDELVRQALRNREMMVGHLETWASGLQQLREIAKNRMPSVSDLLAQGARSSGKPGPANPTKSAPQVGNNLGNQTGAPGTPANPAKTVPAVPRISDVESGFNESAPQDQKAAAAASKSGTAKFGLPSTVLQGGPAQPPPPAAQSPAEEKLAEAVDEQARLLADFQKVRDELQKIMDDLEDSTFVKRLKSASREQLQVAEGLNRTLFDGFGINGGKTSETVTRTTEQLASRENAQSEKLQVIQDDLQAYFDRRAEQKFGRILREMEDSEVVSKIAALGETVRTNHSGESISSAEYWADTLDRWAEEMVSASKCGQCKGGNSDSLPPSIVLEVMRILEGEMDLREETRAAEKVRSSLTADVYATKAGKLASAQQGLYERCVNVVIDIEALPLGTQKFAREIQVVEAAANAMGDAWKLLKSPATNAPVIAAETEAIELLLQSRRANPKSGGGGGGGSTPGGGGSGSTDQAALELYGPTADPNASIEKREIQQATGTATDQIPAEFRDGVDAFFNAVENR